MALALVATMVCAVPDASARKRGYKLKTGNKTEQTDPSVGTFLVTDSICPEAGGYSLAQVVFSGYDKATSTGKESFFITNNADKTLKQIDIDVEYLTPDRRQLHRRHVSLKCDIAPGDTENVVIDSWDKQHSFHYIKSRGGKRSIPYEVKFRPVSYRLKF